MAQKQRRRASERAARKEVADQFALWIDQPADLDLKVRHLHMSGWCVAKQGQPLREIRARLSGRISAGAFDRERPDVAAFLQLPDAPRSCGFTIDVRVPFGEHRLELDVSRGDGEWHNVYARDVAGPLFVTPAERRLASDIAQFDGASGRNRLQFWIHPEPGAWPKRKRHLRIEGWCFAREAPAVTALRARIGRRVFPANYGGVRADVAVAHERRPGSLRSGFNVEIIVPPGPRKLVLEVKRGDRWEEFFARRVTGPLLWQTREDVSSAIGDYPAWIRQYDTLTAADRKLIAAHIARFQTQPLISILLPVYNSNLKFLRRAIASVRAQLYGRWELCVVDDASTDPQVWRLLERSARRDPRIRILRRARNGHIAAASNDALQMAKGEFIALLDHDDELASTALYHAAHELNLDPQLQLLYSDEDKLDASGSRRDPHFKPTWNPDLFLSQNYISHLSFYRADVVRRVGGFRVGFEGAQDYDLTLRVIEQIARAQIRHIPHVLYHWRSTQESTAESAAAKPYALEAARRAVDEHLHRTGLAATVETAGPYLRVRYALPENPPSVSIIIPTRDRVDLLRECVESILARTDYPNFELVIIDNESSDRVAIDYLAMLARKPRVRILRQSGAFNFSRLNNIAVAQVSSDFVLLLNNDIEAKEGEWLRELVSYGVRPGVGAVGARLWFPDGRIQHAGVVLGLAGIGSHAHMGLRRNEHGYFSRPHLTHTVAAVTGACLLVRRDLYLQLGGLDEVNLPVAFNDIDFCLRVGAAELRVVYTPHAELVHHESASRGYEDTREKQQRFQKEGDYMRSKWGPQLEADPTYNPNLALEGSAEFKLAFPPRVAKPWRDS